MINILFCSDEGYASKLAVALSSLLDSNKKLQNELHIIIRTNNMTIGTGAKLRTVCESYGLLEEQLKIVYTEELCKQLEAEKVKKFKDSYMCYFKLFGLDKLLNDGEERLLVVDCDTLICDSIEALYNYDLLERTVGAVKEFPSQYAKHDNGVEEYNTGVLLWDMKKYCELELEQEMKRMIEKIPEDEWKTGDQTVFSFCLEPMGMVCQLPLRYNFIMNQFAFSYDEFAYIRDIRPDRYYGLEEYEDARKSPCIIHLISGIFVVSPWYYEGNRKIKKIWDSYLAKTPWGNDTREVYIHMPIFFRVESSVLRGIHRILPKRLSRRIFRGLYTGR